MPYLNSRGDVAHGVGGGKASLNNKEFGEGGVFGWIDDDHIAFANKGDGWVVSSYEVGTGIVRRVGEVGGNSGFAGGGRVAWWLGTNVVGMEGIWSNWGWRDLKGGLLGMGTEGEVCYKKDYQSTGPSLIREKSGEEWELSKGSPDYVQIFGNHKVIWMEGLRIHSVGLGEIKSVEGYIWKGQGVEIGGEWWISYYSEKAGIVLHPFGSLVGFKHLPKGDGWHVVGGIGEGVIRIATSRTQGEQPGEIWVRDYDILRDLIRDPWGSGGWEEIKREEVMEKEGGFVEKPKGINIIYPVSGKDIVIISPMGEHKVIEILNPSLPEGISTRVWLEDGGLVAEYVDSTGVLARSAKPRKIRIE